MIILMSYKLCHLMHYLKQLRSHQSLLSAFQDFWPLQTFSKLFNAVYRAVNIALLAFSNLQFFIIKMRLCIAIWQSSSKLCLAGAILFIIFFSTLTWQFQQWFFKLRILLQIHLLLTLLASIITKNSHSSLLITTFKSCMTICVGSTPTNFSLLSVSTSTTSITCGTSNTLYTMISNRIRKSGAGVWYQRTTASINATLRLQSCGPAYSSLALHFMSINLLE